MLLLGIDLGTSSVKVSVVDSATTKTLARVSFPETEAEIISHQSGWAEQSPDQWWESVKQAILKCHATGAYDPRAIGAIGIAYQMHGLVLLDRDDHVLRNAIIWCDSRAIEIGDEAFNAIGQDRCLRTLLNSPGNFTASKLAWVKQWEPQTFARTARVLLPGDFISLKLTGSYTTTPAAMSEAVLWDYVQHKRSSDVMQYFGFNDALFPPVQAVFGSHGTLREKVAARLNLTPGIPITYKAGDQPNNALSLQVMEPGEVAATAGTSGVVYAITDQLSYDPASRINAFAHVNHTQEAPRIGMLLCINGTGIFNRWIKNIAGPNQTYAGLNELAAQVAVGSDGLLALPFGNGAERMLNNQQLGAHFQHLNLNIHGTGHLVRAVQEGIASSFRFGFDIMREQGVSPSVIRANRSNLFLSDVFAQTFSNMNQVSVEFYDGDGSDGAAIGAGIGAGIYANTQDAFSQRLPIETIEPSNPDRYDELYHRWKRVLIHQLKGVATVEPCFT